jgi:DNA repair protein RadA/Sms
MARSTSIFICQQCGYKSSTFMGKCPECNTWGSLVEEVSGPSGTKTGKNSNKVTKIIKLSDIESINYARVSTTSDEFNRVLGGGIVMGSVVLIAGDPGIGKSTLLSHLAVNIADTLYVAGEESPQQIRLRINRIKPKADLSFLDETDVDAITSAIEANKPKLVIVDSIQTMETQDLAAAAGSVSQVRESAHRLQRVAKSLHIPMFIVGHVTKEGTLAGPRTLEHLVDVVLSLEGDPTNNFRILRSTKNRFGPTDEVGVFEMDESGMKEVSNPSQVFLEERVSAPGSAVTAVLTGLRPILVEIQALVTKTNSPIARRVGTGVDNNRLQLLVAVLQKRLRLPLWDQDVFVNVTGGLKITEPAADLAICMAIISSFKDVTLPKEALYIGEVGLLGELRSVRQTEKRIKEANKLGYSKVVSPANTKSLNDLAKGYSLDESSKSKTVYRNIRS